MISVCIIHLLGWCWRHCKTFPAQSVEQLQPIHRSSIFSRLSRFGSLVQQSVTFGIPSRAGLVEITCVDMRAEAFHLFHLTEV
ncbi:hypothetical protein GQ53DRAFT_745128 [Thozetella sp. PMI_491]|nr:hypothetical protein GQ53DRAFT_745128 [Thozetella sp. PMI_491]